MLPFYCLHRPCEVTVRWSTGLLGHESLTVESAVQKVSTCVLKIFGSLTKCTSHRFGKKHPIATLKIWFYAPAKVS